MKSLLIVEDDKGCQALMQAYFKPPEYQITWTGYGKEAIDLAKKQKFDVMILDFALSDIDGGKVIQELEKVNIKIPTIITSAYGEILREVLMVLERKIVCLTKPFQMTQLEEEIDKLLAIPKN